MELLTSVKNERIMLLKKLQSKKYRRQYKKFMVENYKTIINATCAGHVYDELYVSTEFLKNNESRFRDLYALAEHARYFQINTRVNEAVSSLDTPSGILAVYSMKSIVLSFNYPIVYLNGINDPGNLGTIIRTAVAFGFTHIVVDEKCADIYNAKTINAAKDAIFTARIQVDIDGALLKDIANVMPLYATHIIKSDISLEEIAKKETFCVVFGSEAHGVSHDVIVASSGFLRIKTSGAIESLNVASTVAIVLHALFRNVAEHPSGLKRNPLCPMDFMTIL